jgi:hypothetical protein
MKQPTKELQAYIIISGTSSMTDSDALQSYKISCDTGLLRTAMRKLEVTCLADYSALDKWVSAGFGVKTESGVYEFINYGSFLVTETTTSKDTGVTTFVAYDKMINAMKKYDVLPIEYPISLYNYTVELCNACGLVLGSTSLPANNDLIVNGELWANINDITYRDIFTQIAQVSASTCVIGADDKVYFKPITSTGEVLTYDNMLKFKLEPLYGEVNSIVLARTPQEDNIALTNEASVEVNGLTEIKIENNEFADKDRDAAIGSIYDSLIGLSYYPFEVTTEGLGWYEIADGFTITNDGGEAFPTALFNYSITIDGSIKETFKTNAETKTQTQYQYASTAKRVKNTEIIVNKQEQSIENLVTDMYSEDGVINENFTKVRQDIEKIENIVQYSGGNNLVKNSVMFAYDDKGVPSEWTSESTGTLVMGSDVEALNSGGVSGHSFTVNEKIVTQTITVKPDTDETTDKTYYSLSIKIRKDTIGSCYVRLYNSVESHEITVPDGTSVFYKEYTLKELLPKENYYTLEISSIGCDATFTDCMLCTGKSTSQWTQANGEIMNTNVTIDINGLAVKRNTVLEDNTVVQDYTIMSPVEFAGYTKPSGAQNTIKTFSVNGEETFMKKAKFEDEFKMGGIKAVAVTEGDIQGWAFVPV